MKIDKGTIKIETIFKIWDKLISIWLKSFLTFIYVNFE